MRQTGATDGTTTLTRRTSVSGATLAKTPPRVPSLFNLLPIAARNIRRLIEHREHLGRFGQRIGDPVPVFVDPCLALSRQIGIRPWCQQTCVSVVFDPRQRCHKRRFKSYERLKPILGYPMSAERSDMFPRLPGNLDHRPAAGSSSGESAASCMAIIVSRSSAITALAGTVRPAATSALARSSASVQFCGADGRTLDELLIAP